MTDQSTPRVQIVRTVDWQDTDAAGHYHHSSVIRWVEAAEAELHERLNIPGLFGVIPRVRYEVDYKERLWFRDRVTVSLEIDHVGTCSARYVFTVSRGSDTVAARGTLTMVFVDGETGRPAPWPDAVRQRMTGSQS